MSLEWCLVAVDSEDSEFYEREEEDVEGLSPEGVRKRMHSVLDTAIDRISGKVGEDILKPGYVLTFEAEVV